MGTGVICLFSMSFRQNESNKEQLPKEQMLYDHFSKKYEDLLRAKCMAESRLTSYLTEVRFTALLVALKVESGIISFELFAVREFPKQLR